SAVAIAGRSTGTPNSGSLTRRRSMRIVRLPRPRRNRCGYDTGIVGSEQWGREGQSMSEQRTREATAALWQAIEERFDELVGIVAELGRRPSVLGEEAQVQGYLADHVRGSGLATEVWDLDESVKMQPNAGDSGVPFPGRPNVTGKRAGSGGGRSLILNGHIDVVSPEPVSAWTHDPW